MMLLGWSCSILIWIFIHIGGKVRITLPRYITPIPITLQTLFASWGGMQFGPHYGFYGSMLHAISWLYIHSRPEGTEDVRGKTKPSYPFFQFLLKAPPLSFGYVIGMIPCAVVSGVFVEKYKSGFQTQIVAAAIGQLIALLSGFLWIIILKWRREKDIFDFISLLQTFFIPFLPGLLLKSIFAGVIVWISSLNLSDTSSMNKLEPHS